MKLTRHDTFAFLVLVAGLVAMAFPLTHEAGFVVATIGMVGCVLSFLVGDER